MAPEAPSTPKHRELTREQRLQVHTLANIDWIPRRIAKHLDITPRQVQYARSHRFTPQKHRCGPKPMLNAPSRAALVRYIRTSKETRRMPYYELAARLNWNISESTIRRALRKENMFRRIARKKPPISETNKQTRLRWAREHVDWIREQWDSILWTDETWVNNYIFSTVYIFN